jgi:hypothetical protein
MSRHRFDAGERVWIYQMSPAKGLLIEGRATITSRVSDVDEQYIVRFDNEPGETYERFVDTQGQQMEPDRYVRDFNKRIGKSV